MLREAETPLPPSEIASSLGGEPVVVSRSSTMERVYVETALATWTTRFFACFEFMSRF